MPKARAWPICFGISVCIHLLFFLGTVLVVLRPASEKTVAIGSRTLALHYVSNPDLQPNLNQQELPAWVDSSPLERVSEIPIVPQLQLPSPSFTIPPPPPTPRTPSPRPVPPPNPDKAPTRPTATAPSSAPASKEAPPSSSLGATLRRSPTPRYPSAAQRDGVSGVTTLLKVTISPKGHVTRCMVVQSSGRLDMDQSALETVLKKWLFEPARQGNQAVSTEEIIRIDWILK
ncbi:MAG: energy transducer TonB [Candidatus Methylacidiphilales bacterium]